jgi:hypothetical protein
MTSHRDRFAWLDHVLALTIIALLLWGCWLIYGKL